MSNSNSNGNSGNNSRNNTLDPSENPFAQAGPYTGFGPSQSKTQHSSIHGPPASLPATQPSTLTNPFATPNPNTATSGGFSQPPKTNPQSGPSTYAQLKPARAQLKPARALPPPAPHILTTRLRDLKQLPPAAEQPNGSVRLTRTWMYTILGGQHFEMTQGGKLVLRGDSAFRGREGGARLLPDGIVEWLMDGEGAEGYLVPAGVARGFWWRR